MGVIPPVSSIRSKRFTENVWVFEKLFYTFFLNLHFIILFGKIRDALAKATAAARAELPRPTCACWAFSSFRNPPNSVILTTGSLTCVRGLSLFFSFFFRSSARTLRFTIGEIFACATVFNPTVKVATFRLRGCTWSFLCLYVYTHAGWAHRQRVSTTFWTRKISVFLVLLTGFESRVFGSRVRRSTDCATPYPIYIYIYNLVYGSLDLHMYKSEQNLGDDLVYGSLGLHMYKSEQNLGDDLV